MSERSRLYYDEDCGFCRWTLAWVLRWDRRHRLRPVPIESPEGDRELGDLGEARLESWHLVRDGRRWSGGRAFAPLLEELPGGRAIAPIARRLEWALVPGYRWVADHRVGLWMGLWMGLSMGLSKLVPARSKRRSDALVRARRC